MKRELRIVPTIPTDCQLTGTFIVNDRKRILTSEYSFVEKDFRTPVAETPVEINLSFSKSKKEHKLSYECKEDGSPLTVVDVAKKNTIDTFYLQHPLTTINGQPHMYTTPNQQLYFDIIDVNMKVVSDWKEWDNKRTIANFMAGCTLSQVRDICFYYGILPQGLTKRALIMRLVDYTKGQIFVKDSKGNNMSEDFIRVWVDGHNPDKAIRVNCRKAINYKVIVQQVKEGNSAYYIGSELLGSSFENVIEFCKLNPETYTRFVLKGVNDMDDFEDEESATEHEKTMVELKPKDQMEIMQWKNQALDLFESMFRGKKDNGLGLGSGVKIKKKAIEAASSVEKLKEYIDIMNEQKEQVLSMRESEAV